MVEKEKEVTIDWNVLRTKALATVEIQPLESPIIWITSLSFIAEYAEGLVIAGHGDVATATNDMVQISKLQKAVEEERKKYTQPLLNHKRDIDESFKLLISPIEFADKVIRGKVLDWKKQEQARLDEIDRVERLKQEAAEAEAKLSNSDVPVTPLATQYRPPDLVTTETGQSTVKRIRKWRLEDITKVPASYLKLDEIQIGKVVRAGIKEIPGIEIYEEEILEVKVA